MSIRYENGVYVADTARVIGDVKLGANVNVWYGAVIRGDVAPVEIGEGSNVQDNAVIHCDYKYANVIGRNVVIGHGAIVHGERVGDNTLIGMGAIVLGRTKIGARCLIAAGAVVPQHLEVPDGHVVMGVPGKIVRKINERDMQYIESLAGHYIELAKRHVEHPDEPWIYSTGDIVNR